MMAQLFRAIALCGALAIAACSSVHFPSAEMNDRKPLAAPYSAPAGAVRPSRTAEAVPVAAVVARPVAISAPVPVPVPVPAPTVVPVPVAAPAPTPVPATMQMTVPAPVQPSVPAPAALSAPPASLAVPAPRAMAPSAAAALNGEYVLGIGDEVKLTVYGEDDLSGQYNVSSTGIIALPLVGNVSAAGLTISQFEAAVREKLSAGYLNDPRVNAQVANYRPFFILGEVAKPGSYPYVNGMTVLNAVALAGGYTYRADKGDIKVVHSNDTDKDGHDIDEDAIVMPGDIIRVTERLF